MLNITFKHLINNNELNNIMSKGKVRYTSMTLLFTNIQ